MNTWILIAYIASAALLVFGVYMDASSSLKFKPVTDGPVGTIKTREGNKFFRNKDGTFNFKKYLLILVLPIVAVNVVSFIFGELRGAILLNGIVGIASLLQGLDNNRKMKATK